ncbi:MAG: sigma-70 family RNA polymerase sigma factor [Verrucomicrobia bacterium]|nr:MAG: sigma-70 family RNA polymerase sigma factor [Verrucomicrobiota bacterium]
MPSTIQKGQRDQLFAPTQWSVVLAARQESLEALESLCAAYRRPLLIWLRCRGVKAEDAEDCVHGFFEQLIQQRGFKNVAREKGRFRTFLLTAFQNYLRDQHERRTAAKRGGGRQLASLDETREDGAALASPIAPDMAPDRAYDRAWAEALLGKSLEKLHADCARAGHKPLCEALEPVLFDETDAPSYADVAKQLHMSEAGVKMAAVRIRRRLRILIRDEVMRTVANQADLDAELRYLRTLFAPRPSH